MSNEHPNDWIYKIIPAEQIADIETEAKILERNLNSGVTLALSTSNESAINLCRAHKAAYHGDIHAWKHIQEFIDSLVCAVEHHLENEGIDPHE